MLKWKQKNWNTYIESLKKKRKIIWVLIGLTPRKVIYFIYPPQMLKIGQKILNNLRYETIWINRFQLNTFKQINQTNILSLRLLTKTKKKINI